MRSEPISTAKRVAALAATLLWSSCAGAVSEHDQVSREEWERALKVADVPAEILYAIGLQESGTTLGGQRGFAPWPWVLNVNYRGRYFRTRDEARDALALEVKRGNQNVAVGMLQIYLRYNGHRVSDPLTLLDPSVNLQVAAEVLADCGQVYPDTFGKLACYYSGDMDAAGRWYARQVFSRAGLQLPSSTVRLAATATPKRPPQRKKVPTYFVAALAPTRNAEDVAFLRVFGRAANREVRVISVEGVAQ
jgi:hypothetical protein